MSARPATSTRDRDGRQRPQPARLAGPLRRSRETLSERARHRRCSSATTSRSRPRPSSSSARASRIDSLLGVFWGTGVGGGLILDGKPWLGRGGAGEIGHMVVQDAAARSARAGGAAAWRRTPAARRWRPRARKLEVEKGAKTDLFKIEGARALAADERVWAHAIGARRQLAIELIDGRSRRSAPAIASAVNLLDIEAVVIGGGLGVALRRAVRRADRHRRCTRICSTIPAPRPCTWPRSATSAARSARHCSQNANPVYWSTAPWDSGRIVAGSLAVLQGGSTGQEREEGSRWNRTGASL